MKKIGIILVLLSVMATPLFAAYDDGRTERGVLARIAILEGRGLLNIIGMPVEIPRTAVSEVKIRKWIAPVSYPFALITNVIMRTISAANDMVFFPMIAPFTDDLTPLTEPMGLPKYPWNPTEENY